MLVKNKTNNKILFVHKKDDHHFYVENDAGIVQGLFNDKFKKISKKDERILKYKHLFNEDKVVENIRPIYDYKIKDITVKWSGTYPNLCRGKWTIYIDYMELPIPEMNSFNDMGTPGTYERWHFDDNYSEQTETYNVVTSEDDMTRIKNWIHYSLNSLEKAYYLKFDINDSLIDTIVEKICEVDFRSGSCGGCI